MEWLRLGVCDADVLCNLSLLKLGEHLVAMSKTRYYGGMPWLPVDMVRFT